MRTSAGGGWTPRRCGRLQQPAGIFSLSWDILRPEGEVGTKAKTPPARPWSWQQEAERLRCENAWLRERLTALRASRRLLLTLLARDAAICPREQTDGGVGEAPRRPGRVSPFGRSRSREHSPGGQPVNSGPDPMRSR